MLPNDATGDALTRLEQDGSDLTKRMSVEFVLVAPEKKLGEQLRISTRKLGFDSVLEFDETNNEWTCYCTKTIVPSYENVTNIEKQLSDLSDTYQCYYDGFGSFGN